MAGLQLSNAERWHRSNGLFFSGWIGRHYPPPPMPEWLLFTGPSGMYPNGLLLSPNHYTDPQFNVKEAREYLDGNNIWWVEYNDSPLADQSQGPKVHRMGCMLREDLPLDPSIYPGYQSAIAQLKLQGLDSLFLISCQDKFGNGGVGDMQQLLHDIPGLDIVVPEIYPFYYRNPFTYDTSYYFSRLDFARAVCEQYNRVFWVFTQSMFIPLIREVDEKRCPSVSELRLQLFAPLTYGAKGILLSPA